MEKLLSFAIPTYNRRDYVVRLVNHILSFNSELIEVVVSDNASIDGTYWYLRKISKFDERLRVYRNEFNLGFSENLRMVVSKSNAKYIFLISDEDWLNLSLLPMLLSFLRRQVEGKVFLVDVIDEPIYLDIKNIFTTYLVKKPDVGKWLFKRFVKWFLKRPVYHRNVGQCSKFALKDKIKFLFWQTYMSGYIFKNTSYFRYLLSNYDIQFSDPYPFLFWAFMIIADVEDLKLINAPVVVKNLFPLRSFILDEDKVSYDSPMGRFKQMVQFFLWYDEKKKLNPILIEDYFLYVLFFEKFLASARYKGKSLKEYDYCLSILRVLREKKFDSEEILKMAKSCLHYAGIPEEVIL